MDGVVTQPSMNGAVLDTARSRSLVVGATLAAVMAGLLYAFSPMTAWIMLGLALLLLWAVRDLPAAERRWVLGVLLISVALRGVAIAAIAWRNDPNQESFSTIFGDASYAIRMSLWIRNTFVGLAIAPRDYFEVFDQNYGRTSYHTMLAILQVFLGPAPYGVHVLSGLLYLTGVIALYRTARGGYGPIASLVGLTAILFLPSLFLWSILPLKESVYFFCTALAISGVVAIRRSHSWIGAAAALGLSVGALACVSFLRAGGLVIVAGGLVVGLAATVVLRWKLVAVIVLVATPIVAVWAIRRPVVHDAILQVMRDSAGRHLGHVRTPGTNYKLVHLSYYRGDREIETMSFDEGIEFVARSIVAFVVVPQPWASAGRTQIYMAPQQIVWYALVVFAIVGAFAGLGRDRMLTCLLAGNVIVGVLVIAPNSGNVGTLIRHRDMVVPFVIWLSGAGVLASMNWLASRRHAEERG